MHTLFGFLWKVKLQQNSPLKNVVHLCVLPCELLKEVLCLTEWTILWVSDSKIKSMNWPEKDIAAVFRGSCTFLGRSMHPRVSLQFGKIDSYPQAWITCVPYSPVQQDNAIIKLLHIDKLSVVKHYLSWMWSDVCLYDFLHVDFYLGMLCQNTYFGKVTVEN